MSEIKRRGRPPAGTRPSGRERLVAAARRLFARQGYEGTSVHDIAVEAGVVDSALYAHFSGKGEIYDVLVREGGPQLVIDAFAGVDPTTIDDPRTFLQALLVRILDAWSTPDARMFASIFTRDMLDGRTAASGVMAGVAGAQETLAEVIRAWQKRGTIPASLDAKQVVWELIAPLVHVRFIYFQARSSRSDLARGREAARAHIDYALTTLFRVSP